MNYKIAINPAGGGTDIGPSANNINEKEYSLLISNYIKNRLDELNISNIQTRTQDVQLTDEERVQIIENNYGKNNNVIVISNELGNNTTPGVEIIYALRNDDEFAKILAQQFENSNIPVNKYYQLRLETQTELDNENIIRETNNNETVVIRYANVNNQQDALKLKNNYKDYAEAVVRAIAIYTKNNYIPINNEDFYTVKKGDSLYSIAKSFDISVDELKKANNLTTNTLSINQVLKIPDIVEKQNENIYYVKKGDSLYQIAKNYNTTVDNLIKINNLSTTMLTINQELIVPNITNTYTVKKGDSLYKIAQDNNTTVDEIKKLNNLTTNTLSINQVLKIPASTNTYTVKKGDSLYQIAKNNNTTVDEIKKLNNLMTNTLSIGQVLKIPK